LRGRQCAAGKVKIGEAMRDILSKSKKWLALYLPNPITIACSGSNEGIPAKQTGELVDVKLEVRSSGSHPDVTVEEDEDLDLEYPGFYPIRV
jgi:hypothetical protein